MSKENMPINSRQQQTLLLLLKASSPLTLKTISDELQISSRTIQRELDGLDRFLQIYGLVLSKKTGVGLQLEGDEQAKQQLLQHLHASKSHQIYSPEERKIVLMQHLLTTREPTKLFFFSRRLNVAEATISYDLDKTEPWFQKHQLKLIRKPGLGVYVEGDENNIRKAILDLLYTSCSQEQLMDILSSHSHSFTDKMKLEVTIRNRLLNFIDPKIINQIEQAVQQTEQQYGYNMTDSAYVGLIVHIALAAQRLNSGENISIDQTVLARLKDTVEFAWAKQLADEIGTRLQISVPESEVGYIATHLMGAKAKRLYMMTGQHSPVEEYVYPMVRIAEQELKINMEDDPSLIENLSVHLESAINRIKYNMDIRNPLLDYVKTNFPDVFQAAGKAAAYLESCLNRPVPEEEIGYIAMHFGAVVLRRKDLTTERFRVLLACASGMGTSRLLAAQIERELPQINVLDTVSLLHIEQSLRDHEPIDLIISTVPFEYPGYDVAVVNPLLTSGDIELIQSRLAHAEKENQESPAAKKKKETGNDEEHVMKIGRYGEGMEQLLEHIFVVKDLAAESKEQLIERVPEFVPDSFFVSDKSLLAEELMKREQIGGWIMGNERLAMLHCRCPALSRMCVCVLKLTNDLLWKQPRGSATVRTVLVLMAPKDAPKEHNELIGSISAALIEEEFIQALSGENEEKLRKHIKTIVRRGYLEKINAVLRGKV